MAYKRYRFHRDAELLFNYIQDIDRRLGALEHVSPEPIPGGLTELLSIGSGTFASSTTQANQAWDLVYNSASEGAYIPNARGSKQCTDFVHYCFFKWYGFNCGYGDGKYIADNTVKDHPDKFEITTNPKPGSIFSVYGTKNHTGFVIENDGTSITFCDGNYSNGGVRIAVTMNLTQFILSYGNNVKFCSPKE